MKNGVYLLLGLMVVIRSSHGIRDNNPFCKYNNKETNLTALCFHKSDIEHFGLPNYVPLVNLSRSITCLMFQTTYTDRTWHVSSTDYFSRFKNLSILRIYGPMSFSPDLNRESLKQELFNVPTLKELVLLYNEFNSNDHLWLLPIQLRNLTIIGNGYSEFSLKQNLYLHEMYFRRTNLVSMPELSDPPPPLEVVDFRSNRLLEINVDSIALFCRANTLSLDADNLLTPQMYCECDRIKQWIEYILKEPETKFFNKTLNCTKPAAEDLIRCQNYTLDKAKENRAICMLQPKSVIESAQVAEEPTGGAFKSLLFIIGILATVLTLSVLVAVVGYRYFYRPPPETFIVSGKQEDEKDNDDADDELEPEMSDDELPS